MRASGIFGISKASKVSQNTVQGEPIGRDSWRWVWLTTTAGHFMCGTNVVVANIQLAKSKFFMGI